jgi:methylmalonyl-CoA mutase cobalamin-binding subunit
MDRNVLLHDLAEIERHLALLETQLADQRVLISDLDHDGHDTNEAILAEGAARTGARAHSQSAFAAALTSQAKVATM